MELNLKRDETSFSKTFGITDEKLVEMPNKISKIFAKRRKENNNDKTLIIKDVVAECNTIEEAIYFSIVAHEMWQMLDDPMRILSALSAHK